MLDCAIYALWNQGIVPNYLMSMIQDIEPRIFALPAQERADLAARLLFTLPAFLADGDEGVAEALERERTAALEADECLDLEQFTQGISALRGR